MRCPLGCAQRGSGRWREERVPSPSLPRTYWLVGSSGVRRLSPPTCQETEDATSRWGSCWPGPAQEEIGDDGDQDGDKGDDDTCRGNTGLLRPPYYDPRHTIAPLNLPLLESLDGYSFQALGSPESSEISSEPSLNNPQPLAQHRFPDRGSVPASRLDGLRLHRDAGRGAGMLGAALGDLTVQGRRHSFIHSFIHPINICSMPTRRCGWASYPRCWDGQIRSLILWSSRQ